jgi:hypothetical protein
MPLTHHGTAVLSSAGPTPEASNTYIILLDNGTTVDVPFEDLVDPVAPYNPPLLINLILS